MKDMAPLKVSQFGKLKAAVYAFLTAIYPYQLAKIHHSSLDTSHSARNLGFISDEHLTFSDQITSLSKACYHHIRQHRYIGPYLDSSTACTIATSLSFTPNLITVIISTMNYLSLNCLVSQQIQNSLALTIVKAPKSCHITPILRSLHWLRITERIEYKLFSLTYKVLNCPTCMPS